MTQPPLDPFALPTDITLFAADEENGMQHLIVVLRPDQLELIADAVAKKLKDEEAEA